MPSQYTGQLDGGLANDPNGIAQLAATIPTKPSDFVRKGLREGPSSALASAMPEGSANAASTALLGIGDAVLQDGPKIAGLFGLKDTESVYSSGGGSKSGAEGRNPSGEGFAMMGSPLDSSFGAAGGAAGSKVVDYTPKPGEPDIFHKSSDLNLFQIVSQKIDQVAPRVGH
jgi:hypothetical protein